MSSFAADRGAGGSATRRHTSAREPQAPGGSYKFAGANPLETSPRHWGAPQGTRTMVLLVFTRSQCHKPSFFLTIPVLFFCVVCLPGHRGPVPTSTQRRATCRPWSKTITSLCVSGPTSRRTQGLWKKGLQIRYTGLKWQRKVSSCDFWHLSDRYPTFIPYFWKAITEYENLMICSAEGICNFCGLRC